MFLLFFFLTLFYQQNEKDDTAGENFSEMVLTPEGGDPDVLAFEEELENIAKQKRVKEWSNDVQGNSKKRYTSSSVVYFNSKFDWLFKK